MEASEVRARFDDLCMLLAGEPGVVPPPGGSGFGRSALRYQGRIFAMYVRGRVVYKLPEKKVDELVGAGRGVRFDANKGTPMKEWFSQDPEIGGEADWEELAREALAFAGGGASARPR
jgi:hypothetical protein